MYCNVYMLCCVLPVCSVLITVVGSFLQGFFYELDKVRQTLEILFSHQTMFMLFGVVAAD